MRYQIVNTFGFRSLRPVQELATHTILDGANCVILAPTAGGKTESAFFPVLSAMDREGWDPVSVLYVAPTRALLNNQDLRLTRYAESIGRRAFTWHGDTPDGSRRQFLKAPADLLLTTPESLEVMLISPKVPARRLFEGLRAVVIDEVHAFVRDDRGGHLASLLERLSRYCGRDVQRIALSATVGNPEEILTWAAGSSKRAGQVVRGPGQRVPPALSVDYVGDDENAARVIAAMHKGKKRLVFVESRRRVESVARSLRGLDVDTYVTHSSLSIEERAAAEHAFAEGRECVIVATSALELGIDVGDLDHVLQIDAPSSVASFLQRMGRTGRREGTQPNCTFLTTEPDTLVQAAALLRLHAKGYVEPVRPVRQGAHLLAHQLMALALQECGVARSDWWAWLSNATPFQGLSDEDRSALVEHMLASEILHVDGARLSLGAEGERRYGRQNFAELYAVFATASTLRVVHAGAEIGEVETRFVEAAGDRPLTFTLGGRAWRVTQVEWSRGVVHVAAAERAGHARWRGRGGFLSRELCHAMREVLTSDTVDPWWSKRARTAIEATREEYSFLEPAGPQLVVDGGQTRLWTFAGGAANRLLARMAEGALGGTVTSNDLSLGFQEEAALSDQAIEDWIGALRREERPSRADATSVADAFSHLRLSKFQPCMPKALLNRYLAEVLTDPQGARDALR
ncbi:MAG: DEAD/DEAH box helicase [Polyangiales bacterium]